MRIRLSASARSVLGPLALVCCGPPALGVSHQVLVAQRPAGNAPKACFETVEGDGPCGVFVTPVARAQPDRGVQRQSQQLDVAADR